MDFMFEWQKQYLTSERSERENCYHIWTEDGSNFRTQYKSIQYLQTLQRYTFRILQHFATKLCNFTHFSMLFLAVVIYLHLFA
jgi:hypothetical protein